MQSLHSGGWVLKLGMHSRATYIRTNLQSVPKWALCLSTLVPRQKLLQLESGNIHHSQISTYNHYIIKKAVIGKSTILWSWACSHSYNYRKSQFMCVSMAMWSWHICTHFKDIGICMFNSCGGISQGRLGVLIWGCGSIWYQSNFAEPLIS